MDILPDIIKKTSKFAEESHKIFSKHEGSKSSAVTLIQTQKRLNFLSLDQDELLRDALKCIQNEIYLGSYVLAWAAFMDFLEEKIASDNLIKIKSVRKNWKKYKNIDELRENIPDYQIIDAAYDISLLKKQEKKTIQGLLSKRNECAHPGKYCPRYNESLGYIDEILNRIEQIQKRNL